MPEFPHLSLRRKLEGRYQFIGQRIDRDLKEQTVYNLLHRDIHAANLKGQSTSLAQGRIDAINERKDQGLPGEFSEEIIPVFLQVDPQDFDIESLKGFGIEIISEEGDGFIIGANADGFQSLNEKIDAFINQRGKIKDQAAKLWQIVQGTQWRADYILSEELKEKYKAGIHDDLEFIVDISVACYIKFPDRPVRIEDESDEDYAKAAERWYAKQAIINSGKDVQFRAKRHLEPAARFNKKLKGWQDRTDAAEVKRDKIAMERQDFLETFIVNGYGGELLSGFVDLRDSFGFRAKMSGKALKDLIKNYPYVFEISESEEVRNDQHGDEVNYGQAVEVLAPDDGSPAVCVIDSGIQEAHILLAPAVLPQYSKSYVPYDNTTADLVPNGGHGTKVAGAILFGNEIPSLGSFKPDCFLLNARILDASNSLSNRIYPATLMNQIVDDFDGVKIFNLSVTSWGPCKLTHMSAWGSAIDKLIHEREILFIIATGNVRHSTALPLRPGILEHLQSGRVYPQFLLEPSSRISNPAQSLFSITVGSVCIDEFNDADRHSFGKKGHISAFSRSGPGLWGCVKPDVVEFGGDWLVEKNGYLLSLDNSTTPLLVKTGTGGTGRDIGTSFTAPKVTNIVASLAKKFPQENTLLYKALILQSARLPEHVFFHPTVHAIRQLGYGIPDKERATTNTQHRITFITNGKVAPQAANLYSVAIPQELRRPGNDVDILVEVTLVYTAEPRRTRRRLQSYLSSWLSWESSKLGEAFDLFAARMLKNMEGPEEAEPQDQNSIRWNIWSSPDWGIIKRFKRQDSASQKDWTVLKSNILPAELSIAVIGHKGWDKDTSKEVPFSLVISFEATGKEIDIYQPINVVNQIELEEQIPLQAT